MGDKGLAESPARSGFDPLISSAWSLTTFLVLDPRPPVLTATATAAVESRRGEALHPGPGARHGGRSLLRVRPGSGCRQLPAQGAFKVSSLSVRDFKGFYDQIKATPIPEGTWLVLQDLEGQVFNTLRPFGDPGLPKHSESRTREIF